jgi:hypothetical protein
MTLALIPKPRFTALSVFALACWLPLPVAAQSLDYDVFKTKVEPIFLQKRPSPRALRGAAAANHAFSLQPLDKGPRPGPRSNPPKLRNGVADRETRQS